MIIVTIISYASYTSILLQIMQKEKEKYSLWQRLGIYLYNILSSDINVRIHGVPARTVDTRYKNL